MDCSGRKVLACMEFATVHCNAIDTLSHNRVHNKLIEGPDPAQSLPANVAHPTMCQLSQQRKAQGPSQVRDPIGGITFCAPLL